MAGTLIRKGAALAKLGSKIKAGPLKGNINRAMGATGNPMVRAKAPMSKGSRGFAGLPDNTAQPISGGALGMGMLIGAGVGASSGAIMFNGDRSWHGAARGAIGGALGGALMGGGMGAGVPALARQMTQNNKFMSTAGSHASSMVQLSNQLNSAGGRNALFSAGGLMGGFAFGSNRRDHRRGFNQHRGSAISSRG